jgi:FecR protein
VFRTTYSLTYPCLFRLGLLALTMLGAAPVYAKTLTVEGVVSPAWVERANQREPLSAGMQLNDKDKIITGDRARVMLRMAEGSAVKLGENATLALDNLSEKKNADNSSAFGASLNVIKGAFRFTTGVFGKPRAQRNVDVKLGTVTAGIRGTDLWGRSIGTEDLVCLLEGRISVRHDNQEFVMNEPLQFFIAPRNAKSLPIGKAPKKQIEEWSQETEITEGLGATRAGGRLRVELLRTVDQNAAHALESRLKEAGYPAVIDPVKTAQGDMQYAVCVLSIATATDRDALHARLKSFVAAAPR